VKRVFVREGYKQTTSFSPPSTGEGWHSLNYTGSLYLFNDSHSLFYYDSNSAQIARKMPAIFIDQLFEDSILRFLHLSSGTFWLITTYLRTT